MFANLVTLGPAGPREELSESKSRFPFYTYDWVQQAHPGLRSYPFLAQVNPAHCIALWQLVPSTTAGQNSSTKTHTVSRYDAMWLLHSSLPACLPDCIVVA